MVASVECFPWFVMEVILLGWLEKWIGRVPLGRPYFVQTRAFRPSQRLLGVQYSEACMMVRTRRVTCVFAGSSLPML